MPKPTVDQLLVDPDFLRMDKAGQKEILSEISQDFSGLSPDIQNQALNELSNVSVSTVSSVPRGGIGVPVSRDDARRISAQRLVAREREAGFRPGDLLLRSEAQQLANQAGIPLGDVGEVVSTSQFAPTLQGDLLRTAVGAREAGSQALFGVPGAIQSSLEDLIMNDAQRKIFGSQALKERAPEAAIAGGTIGQLVPSKLIGGALTSAAPLSQRFLRGTGIGSGIGALVTGSGVIEEGGLDTNLRTLLERTVAGGVLGGVLGGTIPAGQAVVRQISKVAKRLPQTEDDILHFITDAPSSPKDFKPKLTSGDFDEVLPDLAAQKTGSGLPGVIDANTKLNQEAISFVDPLVKGHPAESLVFNEENIISQARQKLTSSNPNYNIPSEELRNTALDQVRLVIKDINSENYTDTATYANNRLTDLYKSLEPEKYGDQKKALRAIRDVLGDGVKTIIKDRGADPTVWSQYGLRNQLVDRISDVHDAANLAYKTSRGEGLLGKQGVEPTDIIHKIPFVSSGVRISKNLMERVTGGQPEFLNKRIDQLFNKIKPSTAPITGVTPSQRSLLLEGSAEQRSSNLAQQKAIQDRAKVLADQGATPAEVNAYLNEQNQGLSLSQAIQESIPKSMAIQRQSVKQFEAAVKARPTDEVLGDMIHFRNKGEFGYSSMLERELERRLGAKKYSKDWALIKENLGIPQSVEGIDLPRKREILQ